MFPVPNVLDESLLALADADRRRLLARLVEDNPQPEVAVPEDVAESSSDLERLQLRMHHTHLPKLEGEGFVEWDRENHAVTRGPNFEEIRPLLELLRDHEDELPASWPGSDGQQS